MVRQGGVLQFQHPKRQAVHEQHHIRPPRMLVLDNAELVHRQPVVGCQVVEVDHLCLGAADTALGIAVLDRHAVHQQVVQRAVADYQIHAFGAR